MSLELSETLVKGVTTTNLSTLASLAFLLYDHAITFEEEVCLVWRRDWTYGKVLFIFNRYFGLVTLLVILIVLFTPSLTDEICKSLLRWEIVSTVVALQVAGVILVLRIHAVYNRNWKVTAFIIFAELGATIGSCTIDFIDIPETTGLPFGLKGCYVFNFPARYKYTWVPALITEIIQCGFMLYRVWRLCLDKSNFPLLTLLVRDSILYFSTMFSILLVNCLVWTAGPQSLSGVAIGWSIAIPCTIGSRLLLNIRKRCLAECTASLNLSDLVFSDTQTFNSGPLSPCP